MMHRISQVRAQFGRSVPLCEWLRIDVPLDYLHLYRIGSVAYLLRA